MVPPHQISLKLQRRAIPVLLVQLAAGGSLGEAADYLGLPNIGKHYAAASVVIQWARTLPVPDRFAEGIKALADELSTATEPVDYRRRRQALSNWSLDEDAWDQIMHAFHPHLHRRGGQPRVLGDRRRQEASVFIWTRVTGGEHFHAPRPIAERQPTETQKAWFAIRNQFQRHLEKPHSTFYQHLASILTRQANTISTTIDSQRWNT